MERHAPRKWGQGLRVAWEAPCLTVGRGGFPWYEKRGMVPREFPG